MQCQSCIVPLCIVHCALCIVHCALCIVHRGLHIPIPVAVIIAGLASGIQRICCDIIVAQSRLVLWGEKMQRHDKGGKGESLRSELEGRLRAVVLHSSSGSGSGRVQWIPYLGSCNASNKELAYGIVLQAACEASDWKCWQMLACLVPITSIQPLLSSFTHAHIPSSSTQTSSL